MRTLLCGLNWIGDTLMSMPAIETYRAQHPDEHLTLLVKPAMKPLWEMHAAPNAIIELQSGIAGTRKTIKTLQKEAFDQTFIFPNSFRSAFIPFAARIPKRTGLSGHSRDFMLTNTIELPDAFDTQHQAYEYYQILQRPTPTSLTSPHLTLSTELIEWAKQATASMADLKIGLIPGAARGTSKQWPAEHYIACAKLLQKELPNTTLVMGSPNEKELCEHISPEIGSNAITFAGKTTIKQWAALMNQCQLIIANDGGGMHLASAVGCHVIALYGITDPEKTGPLGSQCHVLQKSDIRQRDIPRESPLAIEKLASIRPEEVAERAKFTQQPYLCVSGSESSTNSNVLSAKT